LPGWKSNGERIPEAWKGDVPKRKTFREWVAFLNNSDCFPRGAVPAKLPDAPSLEIFKKRATKDGS